MQPSTLISEPEIFSPKVFCGSGESAKEAEAFSPPHLMVSSLGSHWILGWF